MCLFFVLFVHFLNQCFTQVVKEFRSVYFTGFEFHKRVVKVAQLDIKGIFKCFGN